MSLAIVAACAAVVLSAATPITAYDTGVQRHRRPSDVCYDDQADRVRIARTA